MAVNRAAILIPRRLGRLIAPGVLRCSSGTCSTRVAAPLPPVPPPATKFACRAHSSRSASGSSIEEVMEQLQELRRGFQAHHGELKALASELHGALASLALRVDDTLDEVAAIHSELDKVKTMVQAGEVNAMTISGRIGAQEVQLLNKMDNLHADLAGVKALLADLARGMHATLADQT